MKLSKDRNNKQVKLLVETKERDQETQIDESKDVDLEELASNEPYTIAKGRDKVQIRKPERLIDQENQIAHALVGAEEEIKCLESSLSVFDSCVYHKKMSGNSMIYLLLYVDDMLIAANNIIEVNILKKLLSQEFDKKDLGVCKENSWNGDFKRKWCCTSFSKESYKCLSQWMMEHMSKVPYASAFGSIMYAMICTCPDIASSEALKCILRYLKGSPNVGLTFRKSEGISFLGYVDSDYEGNLDRRSSTTGYIFTLIGSVVSWKSTLQSIVTLSITEGEYMAATMAVKKAIWLKEEGVIKVEKVITDDNAANMLTKIVPLAKFARIKDLAGVYIK
uniref:Reverse transcriptase Ty1/copia-type domain-containing protein n=1 Tax=Solanum lycopersicum TaxID=4081 RepID=A0A3Q7ECC7_SOLLC